MNEKRATYGGRMARAAWLAAAASIMLALYWARYHGSTLLWATGATLALAVALAVPARRRPAVFWLVPAMAAVLIALVVAIRAERQFTRIAFDWPRVAAAHEAALAARLDEQMAAITQRGSDAAHLVGAMLETDATNPFLTLATVRRQTRVDALALFDRDGTLIAWAGDHRGPIPDPIRDGSHVAYFAERPLYSYLYFAAPVKGGEQTAVAAVLVETGLLPRPGEAMGATFAAGTNVPAVFRSGRGTGPGVVWSLVARGDTVAHARLDPVTQEELRAAVALHAQRWVVGAAFFAILLLSIGWLRRPGVAGYGRASIVPLAFAGAAAMPAPLGQVLGIEDRASALAFLLPVPGLSIGDAMALLVAGGALVATLRGRHTRSRAWGAVLAIAAVAIALLYAVVLHFGIEFATPSLLEAHASLWFGLQLALTLTLTLLTALFMPVRFTAADRRRVNAVLVVLALTGAGLLGFVTHLYTSANRVESPILALLWALPLLLLAAGSSGATTTGERLARWAACGFVAATAVLPQLWGAHTAARLASAERSLQSFGAEAPPIVEYLLQQFANEATTRYDAGETGLQLLYRSWVASGLAREPYAVRITLWNEGNVENELGLGGAQGSDTTSPLLLDLIEAGLQQSEPLVQSLPGLANVSKLLTLPLDSSRSISVTVEPRRTLQRVGVIAAYLGAGADGEAHVTLLQVPGAQTLPDSIVWSRSPGGWMSESKIWYPDGIYHAHMEVRFTGVGMRLARGTLLLTFDLVAILAIWAFGHLARGIRVVSEFDLGNWLRSFRARVSFALFAFFLIPTAVFGWMAYRGLSAVVSQAAGAIAQRAVQQAVVDWPQMVGNLPLLAEHARSDVLYYIGGELIEASSPEGLALGVYGAWMAPEQYRALETREQTSAIEVYELEGERYLTAYALPRGSGTLGVPVPLSVGDTARRQRDVADLTLLAAVLGLLLSGVLSIAVGRALAGPINRLQRAAAAVGAGHLSVRLPEPAGGEFGQLFASFNRMVRRLRRARAQEVRTARVLAWGEMAQQIAHEIKNPLTPIKLAVQHLRRAYRDGRPDFGRALDENVDQILAEIDRLSEISRAFSRYGAPPQEAGPLTDVNVAAIVHEAITLYRAGESSVRWDEDLEADLPLGRARADELREVLLNLLENARDAVRDNGNVIVAARRLDGRIELEVSDDGPGIPPELVPRIFDPHFSTRSSGTGLGLAIVRRLVESWGGSVDVESKPGVGTSFRVLIVPADAGSRVSGAGS